VGRRSDSRLGLPSEIRAREPLSGASEIRLWSATVPQGSPRFPERGAQPSGWECLFRAVSASSHNRHNLFRIQQLWWDRTHPCSKAVIDQAALWLAVAVERIPGIVQAEALRRA